MIHYVGEPPGWAGTVLRGNVAALREPQGLGEPPATQNCRLLGSQRLHCLGLGGAGGEASPKICRPLHLLRSTRCEPTFSRRNRSFAFILGGNIGTGTLVLLISLDIRLAALYALGPASVFMLSKRTIRFRPIATAFFGMALMFVGLSLAKASASSLAGPEAGR